MKEMQKIRERLAAFKARSAWDKGVKDTYYINKVRRVTANRHAGSNTPARHNNVKHVAY